MAYLRCKKDQTVAECLRDKAQRTEQRCHWLPWQCALPQFPLRPHSPITQASVPPLKLYLTPVLPRGVLCVVGVFVTRAEGCRRLRDDNVRDKLSLNCASIFTSEKRCQAGKRWVWSSRCFETWPGTVLNSSGKDSMTVAVRQKFSEGGSQ
jgi:hypothetical protein